LLPVALPDAVVRELFRRTEANEGYRLSVDLEKQTITDELGLALSFDIDPFRKQALLKGLDDIGLSLQHDGEISAFEKAHPTHATLYDPAAVDLKHYAKGG
jgi:3-isopropylmalate/(R)-2-methylmalate dehydratase small subunit